ncbi:hypothetical protein [Streptomyces sp. NPDC005890]|uniref:hypothetical protein n=1 Tax=Streptomyces sp. NPDC005890 TaxID=3154568 RepID=UPI0034026757
MSSSGEPKREPSSPLERETGERDVHPEEEGRPQPDTSGETTNETLKERTKSEESPG